MDIKDLAYIAALLDGEGSISLQVTHTTCSIRTHTYMLKVRITNTYKPVLDWLLLVLGGHLYAMKRYKPGYKPSWSWEVAGADAVKVLRVLLP